MDTENEVRQDSQTSSSIGFDPKLTAFLCYFLSIFASFVPGLVFYLLEKDNKLVKFHALQSILFNLAIIVIGAAFSVLTGILTLIPILGWLAIIFIWLAFGIGSLIYWIILMIKAYQGEFYKIPVIGDWAEKNI